MSEEEIIYITKEWFLKNAIEIKKHCLTDIEQTKFIEAIQGLLDLYQEEKEKNEKLNKLKGYEMLDIFNMGKESSRQRIKFDWVEKSKIKEKIEEINTEFEDYENFNKNNIIEVLQELLKGE